MSALGFRFCPTEEGLVFYYLLRKNGGVALPEGVSSLFFELDILQYEPSELCAPDEVSQAVFQRRDRSRPGSKTQRQTPEGFWKPSGNYKEILPSQQFRTGGRTGLRKSLVYYRHARPKAEKTDYVIHEYSLVNADRSPYGEFVLCRVKQNRAQNKDVFCPIGPLMTVPVAPSTPPPPTQQNLGGSPSAPWLELQNMGVEREQQGAPFMEVSRLREEIEAEVEAEAEEVEGEEEVEAEAEEEVEMVVEGLEVENMCVDWEQQEQNRAEEWASGVLQMSDTVVEAQGGGFLAGPGYTMAETGADGAVEQTDGREVNPAQGWAGFPAAEWEGLEVVLAAVCAEGAAQEGGTGHMLLWAEPEAELRGAVGAPLHPGVRTRSEWA